jgi:hypothetical protein
MLEAIGKRELIVLDGLGVRLRGTYHRPADWVFNGGVIQARAGQGNRTGVLFVNSLSLPRAASGDSAVTGPIPWPNTAIQRFASICPALETRKGARLPICWTSINAGGLASVAPQRRNSW